jgi:hypothetical protein
VDKGNLFIENLILLLTYNAKEAGEVELNPPWSWQQRQAHKKHQWPVGGPVCLRRLEGSPICNDTQNENAAESYEKLSAAI